jgi:Ca2+-binding EF-hand superfamily protein
MKSTLIPVMIAALFASGAVLAQSSAPAGPGAPQRGEHKQNHFNKLDKNQDGAIDRSEAGGHKHLEKEFDAIDTNKDGKLSKDELREHHAAMRDKHKAKFDERFKAADANGDGALSKEEAAKMPGLAKHFDKIDANKDGKITREEMRAAMMKGRQARAGKDAK